MAIARRQQVGDGIAGDPEQSGMAERHKSGIADEHAQAERKDGVQKNLAGDIDVIASRNLIRDGRERGEREAKCNAAARHGACRPNRPCGRRIRTSNIGRNSTKYASSGMSAWPKL